MKVKEAIRKVARCAKRAVSVGFAVAPATGWPLAGLVSGIEFAVCGTERETRVEIPDDRFMYVKRDEKPTQVPYTEPATLKQAVVEEGYPHLHQNFLVCRADIGFKESSSSDLLANYSLSGRAGYF